MNLARLVGEESPLSGAAHLVRNRRDGVGANGAVYLFTGGIGEGVAGLASAGEIVINDLLAAALGRATQHSQVGSKAQVGMAAGIHHLAFMNGLDTLDGRGFVGWNLRLGDLWNRERGDDEDDGDDDQQFDQGESAISIISAHVKLLSQDDRPN